MFDIISLLIGIGLGALVAGCSECFPLVIFHTITWGVYQFITFFFPKKKRDLITIFMAWTWMYALALDTDNVWIGDYLGISGYILFVIPTAAVFLTLLGAVTVSLVVIPIMILIVSVIKK